ncbi:unnamed protein product [Knipowitschia caucasica]|uniref:C2 domain-containing protein n=1 Tax=Knipowitschia caucasica TaxID=637954 RepID=A0AAV2LJN0_KNICA
MQLLQKDFHSRDSTSTMNEMVLALSLSALLFALVSALTLWCLRRSRLRRSHQELTPLVPQGPWTTSGPWTTPAGVPFEIPPRFFSRKPEEVQLKDLEQRPDPDPEPGPGTGQEPGPGVELQPGQNHRGSLSVSSWYPLGSVVSSLYPSSPASPPSPLICFSLQYRPDSEQLLVSLLRLSNLPPGLCSDTMIQLRLLPEDRRHLLARARTTGTRTTETKTTGTTGAVAEFHHSTVFQVSPQVASVSTLSLSVLSLSPDSDHRPVGRVDVPLRGHLCHTGRVQWKALQTHHEAQSAGVGEVLVSLSHNASAHRLTAAVVRARGLKDNIGLVVQVSVQVQSQLKSRRGPVLDSEDDPRINQNFSFKLKPSRAEQSCVRVEVLHQDQRTGVVPLGALILGPFMFARGPQLSHWTEALGAAGGAVERWHQLGPPL